MKVLNFGSLNLDYVYAVDHIIAPGETESTGGVELHCGGKGLNQSIAMAKAGVEVFHAGLVGEEGQPLIDACVQHGVRTDYIRKIPGRSGHTIIQVDREGQNSILLFGGSNRAMTKDYIDEVLSHFEKGDIIILQNEINLLDYIIDSAFERGMMIVLNPSPFDAAVEGCNLGKISLFLLNEIEGGQITGETEPDKILASLREKFPKAKVVLTLGGDGSIYSEGEKTVRQGIYRVKAVDTTAAGDTFTGYFVSSIINGLSVEEGLALSAKASAISVTRPGATDSIPEKDEVLNSDLEEA
ncbi:MAG: ribokinase [Lachnospiraceae bacterium]|nr:ribokinase [Lachnospiraceae bacterium]